VHVLAYDKHEPTKYQTVFCLRRRGEEQRPSRKLSVFALGRERLQLHGARRHARHCRGQLFCSSAPCRRPPLSIRREFRLAGCRSSTSQGRDVAERRSSARSHLVARCLCPQSQPGAARVIAGRQRGYNVEGRPRRGSLVAARTTRPPTYPRRENERAPSWFNSAQGVSQESWRSFVQKRLKTATSSRRGRSSRSKSTVVSTVAGISFSTPRADLLAEMICDFQLGGFLPPLIFVRSGRDDSLHFIVIITIKYDL
jgi:hypothetical protein